MAWAAPVPLVELDAERMLLGSLFETPSAFGELSERIKPDWFSDPLARYMFEECARIITAGHTLTAPVVISMLPEDCNGTPRSKFYADARMSAVPMGQASGLIETIKDRWSRRQAIAVADTLSNGAKSFGADPLTIASQAISELDGLVSASSDTAARRVTVGEAADLARTAAEDRVKHGVVSGVSWGLHDLDRVTRLHPADLTICAARPSMGKTTLGLHTCLSVASQGEGVLFVSLEMGDMALGQRVLSAACWDGQQPSIPYADIRDGDLSAEQFERMAIASQRLGELPLIIEQEAGLTATQIVGRARKARKHFQKKGQELGLVVIDHLGLIAASDRYAGSRHLELGSITVVLKALAKELGIPVLLLCQLSRGVEGRENKRPMLSDLRESGQIEENADCVVFLYREAYYLERARETDHEKDAMRVERLVGLQNTLEISVAKQRQGATKTVEAFVSMPSNVVRNAARRGF